MLIGATLWSQQVFASVCKALFIPSPQALVRTVEQQAAFVESQSRSVQEQIHSAQAHLLGILNFAPKPHKVSFRAQKGLWGWEHFSGVLVGFEKLDGSNYLVIRNGPGTFETQSIRLNRIDSQSFQVIEAARTLSKSEAQYVVSKLEVIEAQPQTIVRVRLVTGAEYSGSVERLISNYDQTPMRVVLNDSGSRQTIWADQIVPESIEYFSAREYYR